MKNDILDEFYLDNEDLVVNTFGLSIIEDNLVIKTLKPKLTSYIWTVLVLFLVGGFFLFLTIYYFIEDGASLFLLMPLFFSLICIIPGILTVYASNTNKEKWIFNPIEIEHTNQYGEKSNISQSEVNSIFIEVERRNTYGNYHSLISIHLKFNDNKTRKLIQLDDGKKNGFDDAHTLAKIISGFWGVPIINKKMKFNK